MASSEKKEGAMEVSSAFLLNLAGELRKEWLDVGRYLNISDSNLHNIREDNKGNTKEAKYQMLMCWKEGNGLGATHSKLAEALLQAKREDLSKQVKQEEIKANKRAVEHGPSSKPTTSSSKRQRTVEKPSVSQSTVKNEAMTASMKRKKSQFVKELRKKYRNMCGGLQPVPFLRDKYDIDELFVQSGIKFMESKQRRGKGLENWRALKSYKMVFTDPRIKSNRRIIDGEPGYGKTTLALQITQDWCQEIAPMNDVDILILLRLRQLKSVPTVYSAIKMFLLPKDSKITEDDVEDILEKSSSVFLLDGYDEYPDRGKEDNIIEDIIREDMFQNHEVILTTRTSCLPPDCSLATKMIRLTGFDDAARDSYVQNVVAGGSSKEADKIKQFFKDNPVSDELSRNPLFFAMISFMVYLQERFYNLKTVTDFFRHIMKCFYTHKQIKDAKGKRQKELDHSALDRIAFEGLCEDSQQMSWDKNHLRSKIGTKLYNEYIRIGLLIEEDSYDYDAMEYKTVTSFYHKLFVEWYAAHYLVTVAARPETEFEPWPDSSLEDSDEATNRSQSKTRKRRPQRLATASVKMHLLKSLDPNDVQFMYRYACGLNGNSAVKIIEHLAKEDNYDDYTLLCITEWGGSFEEIIDTVTSLCSRGINIDGKDSVMLHKPAVELIRFASDLKIPIFVVELINCLDLNHTTDLRVKPSNLSLPVIENLGVLEIEEDVRKITEEYVDNILQYSAKCRELREVRELWVARMAGYTPELSYQHLLTTAMGALRPFLGCLLPRCFRLTKSMSVLRARDLPVMWLSPSPNGAVYLLNLESGHWENMEDLTPMTDEDYQREVEEVREREEFIRQLKEEEAKLS